MNTNSRDSISSEKTTDDNIKNSPYIPILRSTMQYQLDPGLPDSLEPKKPNALSKKAKKSQTLKLGGGLGPSNSRTVCIIIQGVLTP